MKSYTILILTTIFNATNAFTVYSPDTRTTLSTGTSTITTSSTGLATATRRSKTSLGLATAEISDGKNNSRIGLDLDQSDMSPEESWQEYLQSREVQEVKEQLIQKYLSLGRSQEYAEKEIDTFLNDKSRSQKFLEMRKYVKSQQNASLGFENFFFYGGAFFVGLLGDATFKYILQYQELYPQHNGPIPFL
jgi:hypothetical protein